MSCVMIPPLTVRPPHRRTQSAAAYWLCLMCAIPSHPICSCLLALPDVSQESLRLSVPPHQALNQIAGASRCPPSRARSRASRSAGVRRKRRRLPEGRLSAGSGQRSIPPGGLPMGAVGSHRRAHSPTALSIPGYSCRLGGRPRCCPDRPSPGINPAPRHPPLLLLPSPASIPLQLLPPPPARRPRAAPRAALREAMHQGGGLEPNGRCRS